MNELLKVCNLSKGNILNNISFEMKKGEMTAVMGPSGSGKSTLLYNVSGMDRPDEGEVFLEGIEISSASEDEKAKFRLHKMGFVFQQMNVLNNLNVIDNIAFPAVHADRKHSREIYEKAEKLMDDFHIGDLACRKVNEISGGQLQRACICRSMMMDPVILFADEPTGALNRTAAAEVIDSFLQINKKGTTILMVTHDSKVASMCERIIYLLDGEIRGELRPGKYSSESAKDREKQTVQWLNAMGW